MKWKTCLTRNLSLWVIFFLEAIFLKVTLSSYYFYYFFIKLNYHYVHFILLSQTSECTALCNVSTALDVFFRGNTFLHRIPQGFFSFWLAYAKEVYIRFVSLRRCDFLKGKNWHFPSSPPSFLTGETATSLTTGWGRSGSGWDWRIKQGEKKNE